MTMRQDSDRRLLKAYSRGLVTRWELCAADERFLSFRYLIAALETHGLSVPGGVREETSSRAAVLCALLERARKARKEIGEFGSVEEGRVHDADRGGTLPPLPGIAGGVVEASEQAADRVPERGPEIDLIVGDPRALLALMLIDRELLVWPNFRIIVPDLVMWAATHALPEGDLGGIVEWTFRHIGMVTQQTTEAGIENMLLVAAAHPQRIPAERAVMETTERYAEAQAERHRLVLTANEAPTLLLKPFPVRSDLLQISDLLAVLEEERFITSAARYLAEVDRRTGQVSE